MKKESKESYRGLSFSGKNISLDQQKSRDQSRENPKTLTLGGGGEKRIRSAAGATAAMIDLEVASAPLREARMGCEAQIH